MPLPCSWARERDSSMARTGDVDLDASWGQCVPASGVGVRREGRR